MKKLSTRRQKLIEESYLKIVGDGLCLIDWNWHVSQPYFKLLTDKFAEGEKLGSKSPVFLNTGTGKANVIIYTKSGENYRIYIPSRDADHSLIVKSDGQAEFCWNEAIQNNQVNRSRESISSSTIIEPSLPSHEELDFLELLYPNCEDLLFKIREEFLVTVKIANKGVDSGFKADVLGFAKS